MNTGYTTAGYIAQQQTAYPSAPSPLQECEPCDPREDGNHIARLQVAAELVSSLNSRSRSIADRINSTNSTKGLDAGVPPQHMDMLRFPDDIIAAVKEAHIHLNRIEGALGV